MAYGEKVYKVKNGRRTKQYTWRSRYRKPDGSLGSEPGFPTERLAEKWGREQEDAIEAGRWIDPDLARAPFGKWAREWMKVKKKRGRTVGRRWDYLETYIFPKWEHTPLDAITWFDVDAWQVTLPCDSVTAGHCVSLMSSILTGAVDAKRLLANPLYGRRRTPRTGTVVMDRPKKSAEEKWAPPEVVLQIARRMGPANGLHVLTVAFTGLNWGESLALPPAALTVRRQAHEGEWFECPILRLEQEIAEYEERDEDGAKLGLVVRREPLKNTARKRDIDLPPFLAELMQRHLADWPHEWIFCTSNGKWWRRSNFRRLLRPAADGRDELEARRGTAGREAWAAVMAGVTMRDLRHTHDTYQAQIGVKPVLAHEQAGHKLSGIKGVYQHPTPDMRVERLEGLQEIYERAVRNLKWDRIWE